jgi:hypothetical protein
MRCVCGADEGGYHQPGCSIYQIGGKYTGAIKFEPNKDDDTLRYSEVVQEKHKGALAALAPLDVHSCLETTLQLLATKAMQFKRQGRLGPAEYLEKAWSALMDVGALLDG